MLHVVHHFQQEAAKQPGDEPGHADLPAQSDPDGRKQTPLQGLKAEEGVGGMPRGEAFAAHVFGFNLPGGPPRDKHRSEPKHLKPFVASCGSGVLLGGHVSVVALVVLDEEVRVQGGGEQGLGEQLVVPLRAVSQFVGHVDAQNAAREPHGQHKAPPLQRPHCSGAAGKIHQEPRQQRVLDEHHGPQEHVVGPVLFDHFQFSLVEVSLGGRQNQLKGRQHAESVCDCNPGPSPFCREGQGHDSRDGEARRVLQKTPFHGFKVGEVGVTLPWRGPSRASSAADRPRAE